MKFSPCFWGILYEMKGNEIFQPLESPKCQETTFVNKVMQISLAK